MLKWIHNVKNEHAVTFEIWMFTGTYICLHPESFNLTPQTLENPSTSKFILWLILEQQKNIIHEFFKCSKHSIQRREKTLRCTRQHWGIFRQSNINQQWTCIWLYKSLIMKITFTCWWFNLQTIQNSQQIGMHKHFPLNHPCFKKNVKAELN